MSLSFDVTSASLAISGLVVVVAIIIGYIQYYYQKKQYRLTALFQVHQWIRDEEARTNRKSIYEAYKRYNITKDETVFELPEYKKAKAEVQADLDIIGSMVARELIPKEEFLELYWDIVFNIWKILKDSILEQRKKTGLDSYMRFFEKLNEAADEYRQRQRYPEPVVY